MRMRDCLVALAGKKKRYCTMAARSSSHVQSSVVVDMRSGKVVLQGAEPNLHSARNRSGCHMGGPLQRRRGGANFLPMLIDIFRGTPYLVVSPMGCLSHNKWGRPNPPYVVFKYQDKEWKRILLQDMPNEIATPNLIFSAPDIAVEKIGKNFVAADVIQQIISGYRQPEYRTILREPLAQERCPQYSSGPKAPIPITPGTSPK